MRQFHKSPERSMSTERMGGLEERTSEVGRARAEAERREAAGIRELYSSEPEEPAPGKRRGRARSHERSIRRPRRR